jgi:hypothetical protein
MSATQHGTDRRRFRLAANQNETIVVDRADRRRFRLAANQNETTMTDGLDTEGHRLAANDNENVVDGATPPTPDAEDDLSPEATAADRA